MLILLGPTFQVQTDHLKGTFGRLSGTISVADVDYRANCVEFGLVSDVVFRTVDAPNLLFQIDADNTRGGLASFFGTETSGPNINRNDTPGAMEASLNVVATTL